MPNFRGSWLLLFGGVMGFALGGSIVSFSMTSDLNFIEQLFRLGSYIATPIGAVAAVFIARRQAETAQQQTRVNERKYDADLYERRLRIYDAEDLCSPVPEAGRGISRGDQRRTRRPRAIGARCQSGANFAFRSLGHSGKSPAAVASDGWPSGLRHRS
jgi:hypothetical protein